MGTEDGMILTFDGGKLHFGQSYLVYREDNTGFNWKYKLGRDRYSLSELVVS